MAKTNLNKTERFGINSLVLRVLAAIATVCYCIRLHLGAGPDFFSYLNWFAFPIFAFLLTEGFEKSSDRYIYLRRILIFAQIAEIPYNYAVSGSFLDTTHQNVLFTLLAAGTAIYIVETIRIETDNLFITILAELVLCFVCYRIGTLLNFEMADYGVLLVMLFYAAQKITYPRLFLLVCLGLLSFYMKTETHMILQLGKYSLALNEISMSIPAMAAILLYNGKRGPDRLPVQLSFYLFYPLLLTIIAILR